MSSQVKVKSPGERRVTEALLLALGRLLERKRLETSGPRKWMGRVREMIRKSATVEKANKQSTQASKRAKKKITGEE